MKTFTQFITESLTIEDPKKGAYMPYVEFMEKIGRKTREPRAKQMRVHIFKDRSGGRWKYAGSDFDGKILYDTTWNLTDLQVKNLGLD